MRGRRFSAKRNCALIVLAQSIVLLSVKVRLDARHVEQSTILPCVKKQIHCSLPLQVKVLYNPVVMVCVKGVRCRALLDTAAGRSYISSAMVRHLEMKPSRTEQRRIEMLMANTVKTFNIHELEISDDNGTFTLETEVTQVDRDVIMTIPNPQYQDVLKKYSHLKGVKIIDEDTKKKLPVQIILGASDYSRIKTSTGTLIGNPGEPIAEYTRLGWTLMSPGKVGEHESMMLTWSTIEDYLQLCTLDVLDLEDKPDGDQSTVYDEFKE